MYEVGRCLLRYRLSKARMSQRDLAEKTGKSETTISDYTNNRIQMSLGTAYTIARALRCNIEDLYDFNKR